MRRWRYVAALLASTGGLLVSSIGFAQAAGALAVGSCGAYGVTYDFPNAAAEAAGKAALRQCTGPNCKLVTSLRRGCGALAIDGHNSCGALGYASAPKLGQAQNTALRLCYQYGGKDCVIRAWVCDAKG